MEKDLSPRVINEIEEIMGNFGQELMVVPQSEFDDTDLPDVIPPEMTEAMELSDEFLGRYYRDFKPENNENIDGQALEMIDNFNAFLNSRISYDDIVPVKLVFPQFSLTNVYWTARIARKFNNPEDSYLVQETAGGVTERQAKFNYFTEISRISFRAIQIEEEKNEKNRKIIPIRNTTEKAVPIPITYTNREEAMDPKKGAKEAFMFDFIQSEIMLRTGCTREQAVDHVLRRFPEWKDELMDTFYEKGTPTDLEQAELVNELTLFSLTDYAQYQIDRSKGTLSEPELEGIYEKAEVEEDILLWEAAKDILFEACITTEEN